MKSIFKLIMFFICVISNAYSISYSVHDLGLGSYESSNPCKINHAGTIVGKFKERDESHTDSYTDFMWTSEKGLILLNPKQATEKQNPFLNENNQVIGLYWKQYNGWFHKYQDQNLYTYSIDNGFIDISPPSSWEREQIGIFYTPWAADYNTHFAWKTKSLNLLGYTDKEELLVKQNGQYGIWQYGTFTNMTFNDQDTPMSMDSWGRIFILRTIDTKQSIGGYVYMEDLSSDPFVFNYFEDHPEDALENASRAASMIFKILKQGKVLGAVVGVSQDKSVQGGYIWTPEEGYTLLKNFIPLTGNDNGQMIGFGLFEKDCSSECAFWENGQMHKLEDLISDKEENKLTTILNLVDMNDKGQIIIQARGADGDHAYLLNPN